MLEQAIAENTSAIRDLIAAISKGLPTTPAQVAAVVQEAPAVAKKTDAPAQVAAVVQEAPAVAKKTDAPAPEPKAAAATPHTAAAPDAATPTEPTSVPSSPVVDFNTLKTAFLAQVQANREKAVGVLAQFSISKLSDAKPDQYAAILAAVQG